MDTELRGKINSLIFMDENLELDINAEISKLENFFSDFDDLNSLFVWFNTFDADTKKVSLARVCWKQRVVSSR